jgi:hypothetical protein
MRIVDETAFVDFSPQLRSTVVSSEESSPPRDLFQKSPKISALDVTFGWC